VKKRKEERSEKVVKEERSRDIKQKNSLNKMGLKEGERKERT
jgi:hypothetical protein